MPRGGLWDGLSAGLGRNLPDLGETFAEATQQENRAPLAVQRFVFSPVSPKIKVWEKIPGRHAMTRGRLSKVEQDRLLASALREKERKQAAYQKVRASNQNAGLTRVEKYVPGDQLDAIRTMVATLIKLHGKGAEQDIQIATGGEYVCPIDQDQEPTAPTVSPATPLGLGPRRRKRLQNARSRARKMARGLKRVTFTVPSDVADWISGMISQIVSCYTSGRTPTLTVATEGQPDIAEAVASPMPSLPNLQKEPARRPESLFEIEPTPASLFDDIQAIARLSAALLKTP